MMVYTRPPPAPAHGRIPYPTADTLAPGDVGHPPSSAINFVDLRRGSSPEQSMSMSASVPTGGLGLQRLKSMRDRVRDRSRDRSKPVGRDRAGSVAVATLGHPTAEHKDDTERETSTQGLKNWWKTFSGATRSTTPSPPPYQSASFRRGSATATTTTMNTRKVFGLPLSRVLTYAAMQISTSGPDGSLYVWGEVPIVVGRCGAYLKSKTDIEGIFRVSGSTKRMRDLQSTFDEGPTFGADIDWETSPYTPHDVATIFRRYLTLMPEPVIPFAFYQQFRDTVNEQLTTEMKVRECKRLIRSLPTANKFLLLYTLDLLGFVNQHSDKNLMTAANLAVIFQPGLLNHPSHDMRLREAAISKDVVELLITHQHEFVMSMAMKLSKRKHGAHHHRSSASSGGAPAAVPAKSGISRPPPADRSGSVDSVTSPLLNTPETEEPAQPHLAIPEAIPENAQPPRLASPASLATSAPGSDGRPVAVRAETDYLVPSDSDDDPPAGGYYIVETRARTASPRPPTQSAPSTAMSFSSSAPVQATAQATMQPADEFGIEELIAPPPPRPARAVKRGRPSLPNLPSHGGGGVPAIDVMDPSESDDDAPPGGYIVFENKRAASARPAPSPSPTPPPGGISLSRSATSATRGALQSADARANSPKPSSGATGLLRRRTLPTKRVSDFTARMRRAVLDA